MSCVRLHQYSKKIKGKTVLKNIDYEFTGGKVYGIQGHNGCGKTMLLRAISGLISASEGYVSIGDKILGRDIDFPESIGVLIENPEFWNNYTLKNVLITLARIKGVIGEKEIDDAIYRVGLEGQTDTQVGKFSLGMMQRMGIAQAIMEKPDIILLDEPTNALDTDGNEKLRRIIIEEKERGALIIVVSHNLEWMHGLCDVLLKMENGTLVEENNEND